MAAEKTPAIVLKVVEFSETSCVITMLTQKAGRISGMAKGARRPKGPFFGAIDLLSVSNVVFLPKKSGNLDLFTEAKLDRRFRPCRWSLARLYAGYYLAELLLETTEPHYPMPEVYRLATDTLDLLQQKPGTTSGDFPVSSIVLWFELRLLHLLGLSPLLDACTGCGKLWNNLGIISVSENLVQNASKESASSELVSGPFQEEKKSEPSRTGAESPTYPQGGLVYFCFAGGGLVGSRCRHGKRDLFSLPRQYVPVLQQFAGWNLPSFLAAGEGTKDLLIAAGHRSVRGLLKHFWRSHLGHRLKLEGPLSQIAAKDWAGREKSGETALDENSKT